MADVTHDAQWDKLRKLRSKRADISDRMILEAIDKEIDSTIDALRAGQAPIPHWVLTEADLLAQFAGTAVIPSSSPANVAAPESGGVTIQEPAEVEREEAIEPPTPEQVAEADHLLRQAKVAQMRGNREEASALLKQAGEVAPGSSAVLEAIGDEFAAQRKTTDAKRYYKRACQADPNNVSADRKYAHLVFNTDVATLSFGSMSDTEVVASAKMATLMNFVAPGLGQIVNGDVWKGIVFLVVVYGCWAASFALGLHSFVLHTISNSHAANYHPAALFLPIVAIIAHIAAIASAKGRQRIAELRRRPTPPENLPFE